MVMSRLLQHPLAAGLALALVGTAGSAMGQITPVPQFIGQYSEMFGNPNITTNFGVPQQCVSRPIFSGNATLCAYNPSTGAPVSGLSAFGNTVNSCTIGAYQGTIQVTNMAGRAGFVFSVSVGRFGGFFGSNDNTTVALGGTIEFYDEAEQFVGSAFLDLGPCGNPGWKWHGWEFQVPIRRIMVIRADESSGRRVSMDALEFDPFVGAPPCYANCDLSTTEPILNVDDFTCFINEFASAQALPHEQQVDHYANCDASTVAPVLNVDDFTCFINAYAAGCR